MHANDTGLIAVLDAFGSFGWRQLRNQFTVSRPRSGKRFSFTTIFCVREKFIRMLTATRNPYHVPEGALIKNVVARNSTFSQFSSHEYRPNVSVLPCTTPTESRGANRRPIGFQQLEVGDIGRRGDLRITIASQKTPLTL